MLRFVTSLIAASLFALSPAKATQAEMTVAEFLAAWDAMETAQVQAEIKETGSIDIEQHPEVKLVVDTLNRTAKAYRATIEQDRKDGRTLHSCLPEGETELSSDDLIPFLRSIASADQQTVTLASAFRELMAQTYPCG